MTTVVVATKNRGKARELEELLGGRVPGLSFESLADHPDVEMAPEAADTFEDNARAKAEHVARVLGRPALADDSGLVVDALGGAPGVHSARYAAGSDRDRLEKLLGAMAPVPDGSRSARFVCAMALAVPGKETVITVGKCEGTIARAPKGGGGFGYDPIFELSSGRTMAELEAEEKHRVSHRGRAFTSIEHFLLELAHGTP